MPQYKYAVDLRTMNNCPPPAASKGVQAGYRFVWCPVGVDCFLPIAKMETTRSNNPNSKPSCSAFAISLFVDEVSARKKLKEVHGFKKGAMLWTHLAVVGLTPSHGRQTEPSKTGHFELFEYADVELHTVSTLVGPL